MLIKISGLNVVINRDDVQLEFDNMAVEWQNFQRVYIEYATLSTDSKELHTIGIRRQQLQRKISDSRQIFMSTLGDVNSVIDDMPAKSEINDDKSDISCTSSANSKRSSTSSKACAAARFAQNAKLKLHQAERKSKLRQKQIKELAELEKTRVELESKRAEAELEEKLQNLRDEVECGQNEAELLVEEVKLENDGETRIDGKEDKLLEGHQPIESDYLPAKGVILRHLLTSKVSINSNPQCRTINQKLTESYLEIAELLAQVLHLPTRKPNPALIRVSQTHLFR